MPSSDSPSKKMTFFWIGLLVLVEVGDEVADAALVVELDLLPDPALVLDADPQARR
jgi:hypothetical protein